MTKVLGQVLAVVKSSTAPENHDIFWKDTSVNPPVLRVFDESTQTWNTIAATSISDLADLEDVNLNNVQNMHVVVYDQATSKWINKYLTLSNLSDIGSSSNLQFLRKNGSGVWVGSDINISDLKDVDLTGLGSNKILKRLGTKWVVVPYTLYSLTDMTINNPRDGDALVYNIDSNSWVNLPNIAHLKPGMYFANIRYSSSELTVTATTLYTLPFEILNYEGIDAFEDGLTFINAGTYNVDISMNINVRTLTDMRFALELNSSIIEESVVSELRDTSIFTLKMNHNITVEANSTLRLKIYTADDSITLENLADTYNIGISHPVYIINIRSL